MLLGERVVLVTGGSRGIGAATALEFARHGAAVAVNYFRSDADAKKVVDAIRDGGGRAVAVRADVRVDEQVQEMVREAEAKLGPIDTLVSNASVGFPVLPFVEYPWEAFEAKLVGELKATFSCCQALVPGMIKRKAGCIIAVSSGLSRHPGPGYCAHAAAKAGLDSFIRSLAVELAPYGIRANVIAPGATLTDALGAMTQEQLAAMARMNPTGRIGEVEDVAGAIAMLASDGMRYVNGAYLPVSGGALMI
jgi:3-oxoacyl-[acyl-carrier protein] reductase